MARAQTFCLRPQPPSLRTSAAAGCSEQQKLKAEQGIKDLQQKIAGQEKKASELSKLAEEEAKAHDEAAHSAEQCSRDLKAKAAEATVRTGALLCRLDD